LLQDENALLAAALAYNSRRAEAGLALPPEIAGSLATDVRLSRILRKRLGASEGALWRDFADETERLLLFAPEELSFLGKSAAAALLGEEISRVFLRSEVLALRSFLGEEIYRWTLVRGKFMAGSLALLFRGEMLEAPLAERLSLFSRILLEEIRAGWAPEKKKAAQELFASLPFPPLSSRADFGAKRRADIWRFLKKIILREMNSKWAQYFN